MQAIGRQPKRAPDGAPLHCERHCPEQTTLYRLVQQHAASFIARTEASIGAELPSFIKDESDAFLECGILVRGFLRLRCGDCGQDKLVAFSCKRRGFCPSGGAHRMAQTAAHLVDHVNRRCAEARSRNRLARMGPTQDTGTAANARSPAYRFDRFELQPAAQRLLADGEPAILGPRAFDLLVALVQRAGQLVPKAELLDLVWPGLVVEENNLQVQISALRKILGADAIATVPGRGYRFTLQPQSGDAAPAPALPPQLPAPGRADPPSIAVLPFVNMSDEAANEYFADGLSEELLNVLSRIRGLRVVSRTSAFSFKGVKADIPTVARKLNVATILEGSVRKAGTRVRVTVQLVHAATDSHLWSQVYDRELEDIFAVQDDIAQSVVKEMRTALTGERTAARVGEEVTAEVQAAVKGRSSNAEAYRLYLEGSFFLNRYNEEDSKKAIESFQRALELDPSFAAAWASLSFSYLHQEANAWAPIAEGAQRAREAARRALAAGPDVAASHWALGAVCMYHDWDWGCAEASIRRALRLAPDDSHLVLAAKLMQSLGQLEEADALIRQALALDPLNVEAHMTSGLQLLYTGRPAQAELALRKALELSPHQRVRVHYLLGRVMGLQGRLDAALSQIQQETHETFRLLGTVLVQHARGKAAESAAAMRELTRKYASGAAYQIAEAHAYRGEADRAFEWLERAYRQRDAGLASMKIDPLMRELHADPRWQPWLERMGFAARDRLGCVPRAATEPPR